MSHYKALFDTLNDKQRTVLGMIAINQDGGHHPATLKCLEDLGLIEPYNDEFLISRFGIMKVKRYLVPLPVHINWCEWCAENCPEEEVSGE
jgi:hypothetical protein